MIWWIIILTLAIAFLVAKRAGAGKWSWLILAAGGVVAVVAIISSAGGGGESPPVVYIPPAPLCFETVTDTVWDPALDRLITAPIMGKKSQKIIVPTRCIVYEIRPFGAVALNINESNQPVPINPEKVLPQNIMEGIRSFDAESWAHGPIDIWIRFARVKIVQKQIPCAT